jgi:hypothetical protein
MISVWIVVGIISIAVVLLALKVRSIERTLLGYFGGWDRSEKKP